jgi:NAD dependent epimerase/dehydratase family enzyme
MLPQMAKPVKNYLGAAFGTGEQWQSWIHIRDLGRLYLYLIQEGLEGVFNGVAPNPVTQNKMLRQLADILDKPLLLPNIPRPLMKLILGEMSYLLFASQRVSSKKVEAHGFEFDFCNICTALENLYQSGPVTDSKAKPYSEEFVR